VTLVSNGKKLKRVKEILDVWFDSGAMPFAQHHFPFENKNLIEEGKQFPADFISEAIDQTRGWFYTLHAISNLLQKGVAFKNVICLGHLLDKDGKKMSKSLGNVVDPWDMADKYGVDTIRLWMYSVNQPGESKNFDEKTVDELRKKFFNLLDNVLSFYLLGRDESLESKPLEKSQNILDSWILARLSQLNKEVVEDLENYKLLEPVRAMKDFIDDLSTWYVRRSRERIREGDQEALSTLYFVLKNFAKILAPFAPFYAEHLFLTLRNKDENESVHLEDFPEIKFFDEDLIKEMENVRALASLGLEARNRANIKVRQPLATLKASSSKFQFSKAGLVEIVKEEVNVKEIVFSEVDNVELDTEITEELRKEGVVREFMRAIQELRKEEGFSQKDKAKLTVSCGEKLKEIFSEEEFSKEIKKVTGLSELSFGEVSGKEITLDGEAIRILIEKI
jgi:isoleucyl-tRNA synthetase